MDKSSNFVRGDVVKILPTATRQKYESLPSALGWDVSMQKDIGQTGTIEYIYNSGIIRVIVPATGGMWLWKPEDLILATSKWRRGECR